MVKSWETRFWKLRPEAVPGGWGCLSGRGCADDGVSPQGWCPLVEVRGQGAAPLLFFEVLGAGLASLRAGDNLHCGAKEQKTASCSGQLLLLAVLRRHSCGRDGVRTHVCAQPHSSRNGQGREGPGTGRGQERTQREGDLQGGSGLVSGRFWEDSRSDTMSGPGTGQRPRGLGECAAVSETTGERQA